MKREIVVLEDDIDGGTADETIEYALDGTRYEIDLSAKNASKLRASLADFLSHSRRLGKGTKWTAPSQRGIPRHGASPMAVAQSNRDQNMAVREWAKKMGYDVSDRGRVPQKYVDEYHACGGIVTKKPEPVKTVVPAQANGAEPKKTVAVATKKTGTRR